MSLSTHDRGSDLSLSQALNGHVYPRILHTSAALYRLFLAGVHLSTLRSWYVRRSLRRLLRDRFHPSTKGSGSLALVDLGCGSGDHLLYASRLREDLRCTGIDRAPDAVALCRAHTANTGSMHFECRDLEDLDTIPSADILLCITVLQYVRDDAALLSEMRRALRKNGALLLYVPVHGERVFRFYDRIVTGSVSDYDAAQATRRIYEPERVEALLNDAGFTIERAEKAYGAFGKTAFEMHALILHGLTHERFAAKAAAVAAGFILLPLMFSLMLLDYCLPVHHGNGLLIQAR